MRRCELRFAIETTPDRFWSLYLDEDFNRESFVRGLSWDPPQQHAYRSDEREVVRELSAQPRLELPPKVARLVGERLGYREWGRFDRASAQFEFRQRTTMFGDKLSIQGRMWGEPRGEAGMNLIAKLEVEASMFGVGGLLERTVEQNFNTTFSALVRHWNQWLKDHDA